MKNAIFGLLWFLLGMFVFASINNSDGIFTDASQQSWAELIDQLDSILAWSKFDNKDYVTNVITKTEALLEILPADSLPYLAIKYINASLVVKVKTLKAPEPVIEITDEDVNEATDEAIEVAEEEEIHNAGEKINSNDYQEKVAFPWLNNMKNNSKKDTWAIDPELEEKLGSFNTGRKSAPEKVIRGTPNKSASNTTSYKYDINNKTYDIACVQLECMNSCLNMDQQPSEATCKKQCVSSVCLDVKKRKKWKLTQYEIEYAPK